MYRNGQAHAPARAGFGKRNRLVSDIAAQIRSGRLAYGDR